MNLRFAPGIILGITIVLAVGVGALLLASQSVNKVGANAKYKSQLAHFCGGIT